MAKKKRQWPLSDLVLPKPVMDNHTHLPVHGGEIPTADGIKMSCAEQLVRAEDVGVERIITVGCSLPDLEPSIELARVYPQVRTALAIHPNEASIHAGHLEKSPDGMEHAQEEHHVPLIVALERVSALLSDPLVVAVGETGLDYFRTGESGREAQKESFRAHIDMAWNHDLPLQIHDREAHQDTIDILRQCARPRQKIVFHCFSGDAQMAKVLAENGWYASFAGPLTYPANDHLRQALVNLPQRLVLVETDAPYLTPVPFRGSPNASYVMPHTVKQIAELWGVSLEVACDILLDTSASLYGEW